MARPNPRLVIGAAVHAKAMHITNLDECASMYGSAADTKMIDGRVTAFKHEKTDKDQRVTTVTARWVLSRHEVENTQRLRSVRAGGAPGPSGALPPPAAGGAPPSSAPGNPMSSPLHTLAEAITWTAPPPVLQPRALLPLRESADDAASQPNDLPAPIAAVTARGAGQASAHRTRRLWWLLPRPHLAGKRSRRADCPPRTCLPRGQRAQPLPQRPHPLPSGSPARCGKNHLRTVAQ